MGGKINWYTGDNYPILTYRNYPKTVEYLSGAALLIKKQVFDKIGLLPLDYFLYYEELDFCTRAKREGFLSINDPRSIIWHKISKSAVSSIKKYYLTRNKIIFMKKFSKKSTFIIFIIWILTISLTWEITIILIKNRHKCILVSYLRGLKDGISIILKKTNIASSHI